MNAQDVLSGLWISQMRALVESIGGDRAIEVLTPLFRKTGISGALSVRQALGLEGGGWQDIAKATAFVLAFQDEGNEIKVFDQSLSIEDTEPCPYRNAPRELCWLRDCVTFRAFLGEFSDEYEPKLMHDIGDDSTNCVLAVTRGGRRLPRGELQTPTAVLTTEQVREDLPPAVLSEFAIRFVGEYVTNTIVAAKQELGEGWRGVLLPAAEEYGEALSHRIVSATRLTGSEQSLAAMIVEFVASLLAQEGHEGDTRGPNWGKEVASCPFSKAPEEVCDVLEAMYDGICRGLDPGLVFRHVGRMTRGEGCCLFDVSRVERGHDARDSAVLEGALTSLKARLASGEISEADFQRMRKLLVE